MKISQDIISILDRSTCEGSNFVLAGQLSRREYEAVNRVIEAAGGKWNRRAKAHVFDGDAAAALDPIIVTGEVLDAKRDLGAFYTPPAVAARVIELAQLRPEHLVLEPSAGRGALAAPALLKGCAVDCVEIDPRSVAILCSTKFRQVVEADFLSLPPLHPYDRIVMNPPFSRQEDIRHVLHAMRFLRPGGRLVAVMASGVTFRTDRRTREFRETVDALGAELELLPEGAFKDSGTSVKACILTLDMPA